VAALVFSFRFTFFLYLTGAVQNTTVGPELVYSSFTSAVPGQEDIKNIKTS